MNDQHDQYKELAGWSPYVQKLKDRLANEEPARLLRQVGSRAGQYFRLRHFALSSAYDPSALPIVQRKAPAQHSLRQVGRWAGHFFWLRGTSTSAYYRSARLIIRRETPAQHSLRQVALFRRLMYKQYADRDAREEPEASNPKAYAALRLKRISQHMGAREQPSGQVMAEPRWTLIGLAKQVLDGGDRTPATVGKMLGMLDWFQHCLAAYEQEKPTEEQEKVKVADAALFPSQVEQSTKVKFRNRFTADDADEIAWEVKLTDIEGNYTGLQGKSAGRLCGFYWRLKQAGKVEGSLEALRDFFAERYLKRPITTTPNMNSNVARDMADDVENALKHLFPTDNRG